MAELERHFGNQGAARIGKGLAKLGRPGLGGQAVADVQDHRDTALAQALQNGGITPGIVTSGPVDAHKVAQFGSRTGFRLAVLRVATRSGHFSAAFKRPSFRFL